jgi:hypothetical protein
MNEQLRGYDMTSEQTLSETRPEIIGKLVGELGLAGRGTLGEALSDEAAHELLRRIPEFMVVPDLKQPWTCMDGRTALRLLSGKPSQPRRKTAGGDLYSMYAAQELIDGYLLSTIKHQFPDASPKELMQAYQDSVFYRALHQKTGGHVSDHAPAHGSGCGCGMCDGGAAPFELIASDGSADKDYIARWTAAGMRTPFNDELHRQLVVPRAQNLAGRLRVSNWQGKDMVDIVTNPKPYDRVEENRAGIEVLGGQHGEGLFVINRTTLILDRDAFVDATGAQIFVVDEGSIVDFAREHAKDKTEAARLYQSLMTVNVAGGLTLVQPELKVALLETA